MLTNKLTLKEPVYHITPLHYFLFIARSGRLKSKATLFGEGYKCNHFRSTSKKSDINRGFQDYIHLSLTKHPSILKAKLQAGFPHVVIAIPPATFDNLDYDLCRYNIARARNLEVLQESPKNGRYYKGLQIPIARTQEEKKSMLCKCKDNKNKDKEIELLVKKELRLPNNVEIFCFSQKDKEITEGIIKNLKLPWQIRLDETLDYNRCPKHADSVEQFLKQACNDEDWKGNDNGNVINFDYLKKHVC